MKETTGRVRHTHISIELLSAYMDGQVSRADRTRIEGHLAGCTTCSDELRSLRQTSALLGALPRVRVPRAFTLSEAMVGQRQGLRAPWFEGWVRGLAAVSAMALVAVVAVSILKQPAWTPAHIVARVAPTNDSGAAPAELTTKLAEPAVASAPSAPMAMSGESAAELGVPPAPAAKALAPSAAPSTSLDEMHPAMAATMAPDAALRTASGAQTESTDSDSLTAAGASATDEPGMLAAALPAPAETPTESVSGFDRGGGEVAAGKGFEEAPVAAQAPPIAPASSVLRDRAMVVYADPQGLWSIDAQNGIRALTTSGRPSLPQISPDRIWVVFTVQDSAGQEVMVVPYEGGEARLILSDEQLPQADLGPGFAKRQIESVSWIGRQHELSARVVAYPNDGTSLAKMELWSLDVDTGAPTFLMDIGTADIAAFSPDATNVALLDFGSEQQPDGGLALARSDGTESQIAIPLTNSYQLSLSNRQLQWLPDGKALWVAIPDAASDPTQPAIGFTVFRVSASGEVGPGTHIAGVEPVWSDNGARLAYYAQAGGSADAPRTLVIAGGDGSNPVPYSPAQRSAWLGWAPDASGFLYADSDSVYLGMPGHPARRIGSTMDVVDPQWLAGDQFLSLMDQGDGWALVSRNTNGESATLAELPRDLNYVVAAETN